MSAELGWADGMIIRSSLLLAFDTKGKNGRFLCDIVTSKMLIIEKSENLK
jgi:hypothetical protein